MKVATAAEMREIDRRTIEEIGIPGPVLMENAARAVSELLLAEYRERPIAVYCGAGNNGGDGFAIVRQLREAGRHVTPVLAGDSARLKGDALLNFRILRALGIDPVEARDEQQVERALATIPTGACHVDALFGTGLTKPISGHFAALVDNLNRRGEPTVAVDVPSGISADSGAVLGTAVRADVTVTFALAKLGLLLAPGAEHAGRIVVAGIGIPRSVVDSMALRHDWLREEELGAALGPRPRESHKGSYGHVLVAAGTLGYSGAALLAGRGALSVGAGLVTVASEEECRARIEGAVAELIHRTLFDAQRGSGFDRGLVAGKSAVVVGPGLGQSSEARDVVLDLLSCCDVPLVIDADALNLLTHNLERLSSCGGPVVVTPHPGEMARLVGCTAAEVQRDRYRIAREFAAAQGAIVVLKGNRTLVAAPDGRVAICTDGNPGMAVGGMGDVLAGMIGGMLALDAQDPFQSVARAVHVHALAGDRARARWGERSLLPSAVVDSVAEVLRTWELA